MNLPALQAALGYTFNNRALAQQALTHRSHGSPHNERLEFLGDGVLNFVVAALLFQRFAKVDEGELTRLRASLVKQSTLAEIARRLDLPGHLRLGAGELKSGGFRRPSILADAVEALLAAVLLDGGFDAAERVISHLYQPLLAQIDPKTDGKDDKTLLQEVLQGHKLERPVYSVLATHGAEHDQTFEVQCEIAGLDIQVCAQGASRRTAEQLAAKQALEIVKAEIKASIKARQSAKKRNGAGTASTTSGTSKRTRQATQLALPVAVEQKPK